MGFLVRRRHPELFQSCLGRSFNVSSASPPPLLFCLILMAGGFVGCQKASPPVSVEGTVLFRKVPVETGAIRFIPDGGNPEATAVCQIEGGRYRIPEEKKLAEGTYLISIYGFKETGRLVKIDENTPAQKEKKQYIPRQYNDATTQQCQLTAGHNTLDFTLE